VAVEVLARKGFDRAALEDIAEAAGVTHGNLYSHRRSKEEFLIAGLDALTLHLTRDQPTFRCKVEPNVVLRRFFHRSAQNNWSVDPHA
jgi:AcrR family transcriptional regulator